MQLAIFFQLLWCAVLVACGAQQPMETTTPDQGEIDASAPSTSDKAAAFRPDLPPIPPFESPSHPLHYDDGSWSVYGLRKNIGETLDQELEVTGVVVKIYRPPVCPSDAGCPPPAMPHLWFGDDSAETSQRRMARLVGYAQSQVEIDEALAQAATGQGPTPEEEAAGLPPLVYDWQEGKRYVVRALFTRSSSTGFTSSDGLLEYRDHRCLDCAEQGSD